MALSFRAIFIRIVESVSIVLLIHDALWMSSVTAYSSKIPEDCSVCGIGIINGSENAPGGLPPENTVKYPWMVSIGWSSSARNCLGAMIDAFHIITAAHCVIEDDGEPNYDLKIHFRNEPHTPESKGGFEIDTIEPHPRYKLIESESSGVTIAQYDIALVKLKQKIKCDANKNPICLPPAGLKLNLGERNIFTGWSFPDPVKGHSDLIRKAFIKNLNFSECVKNVPEAKTIKDHMLCQGGTPHRMCYGDSGGPLIKKINETYHVVGIASSETNTDCSKSDPMIFTDVVKFLEWIRKYTKATLPIPEIEEQSSDGSGESETTPQTRHNTGKKRVARWERGWIVLSATWRVFY